MSIDQSSDEFRSRVDIRDERLLPSRRRMLASFAGGFGVAALAALDGIAGIHPVNADEVKSAQGKRVPHHQALAKSVIQIFCTGAISHLDTFDYKPELERRAGMPFDPTGEQQFFASKPGNCQPSYWKFRQHGESGRWVSDLFPELSTCVDDMAFIYSMKSKSALHGPATFMMNTGFIFPNFPSMGAWVTYGLGSENENLPSFVVLPDLRGMPPGGALTWGAGFLPAEYQGTALQASKSGDPIANLFPPERYRGRETRASELLSQMNRLHLEAHRNEDELEARIKAYELAARLQLSAPEVADLGQETAETKLLYGFGDERLEAFGRQCLMARRLVERGVRFVQIFCGADNVPPPRPNWDAHEDLKDNHGTHGPVLDRGASALLTDLKRCGLLNETLVICTSEFGRQPAAQGKGRDHNPGAFTTWLAGGGIQGGASHGASDELGFEAIEDPCYSYDLHATALHLLGLDHTRLTYYHNGIQRRLTDVHGVVLKSLVGN